MTISTLNNFDYGTLFGSLNRKSNAVSSDMRSLTNAALGLSSGSSLLSDYASIKNGSYTKLLKAYYNKVESKNVKSAEQTDTKQAETDTRLTTAATTLAKASNVASNADFSNEDRTEAAKSVSSFVDAYNSFINHAEDSTSSDVLQRTVWLTNITGSNEKLLNRAGITINDDNTLTLDRKLFDKANSTTLRTLFSTKGSWNTRVLEKAGQVLAASSSTMASIYGTTGKYTAPTVSSLYNSYI